VRLIGKLNIRDEISAFKSSYIMCLTKRDTEKHGQRDRKTQRGREIVIFLKRIQKQIF
jgi:hypothetical protein